MSDNVPGTAPLGRLRRYLESDPKNLHLLAYAASAAYDAQDFAQADEFIGHYEKLAPLTANLTNLKGLVALSRQNYAAAEAIFRKLREQTGDTPALRFNLAWALAMQASYREALELLDDETVAVAPRAPSLKIHAMHHLAMYDEALACGRVLAERYPDNEDLMGALSTLALDMEKADLALSYARHAGGNSEGRAALGFLALGDHNAPESLDLFEQAIAAQPGNPRAWVGKGLSLLASGDAKSGTAAIDRGAALFGDHIGSWIASGWAHFVTGDNFKARESFERALAIDPNFSECHGGLAVMDILAGKLEDAKRRTEIALRLDKNCFGGALAKSLLLDRSGHARVAQKVREIALSTPIGPNGRTIAQELVAFGIRPNVAPGTMAGEARKRPA
jgi:tetratricopeptide (TPR) repeat protein